MKRFKTIRWICNECEWDWETLSVIVDEEQETEQCPSCNSFDVRESIAAPSIRFKGSGFYETDYK
jgi:predicted nucleic acid-binding Zn ribbon protein|tara:strand:- start:1592 stop:1786 length:195 start_codon:yes stop_codon:yes gene_type:complete